MLDCGFCFGFFLLFFCFGLFLLATGIDGFESIVAVDDDLVAFCAFLLRLTMLSADDDAE